MTIIQRFKMISIIIVNYRGWGKLSKCLDSLAVIEDARLQFEVIVVDNRSDDGKYQEFVRRYPQFTFVLNTGNNGFANGCNMGAAHSKGDHLLFLNPDTTVTADALYEMQEEVCVRPLYSVVSCRQLREDGSEDRAYGRFLTTSTLTGWMRAIRQTLHGSIENKIPQTKHYLYPDWVSGSVIMIRRDSFFRLGKWDEDYWMYYEDVDLCRRAKRKGGEVVLLKNAVVGHMHGGSSRINRDITAITKSEVHVSRHIYISKQEKASRAFVMHLLLILDNLLLGLVPALLGTLFFFVEKLSVFPYIYLRLLGFYFNVLKSGIWLSIRSVNYNLKEGVSAEEPVFTEYKQVYH